MQYTSNFNFNLPEGTDLWNYLTQTNPNFTSLDTLLKSIQDGTVTTATEVTSGTAHAVTRTLPDANVIRFTATSVWTLGDTMTIDGTPVTVVKPNGTSLQTGDYIIGSEVLGVLRATQFTVYVGGASTMDASDVTYDNTGSGLSATDVQDAIDEVNSNLSNITPQLRASGTPNTSYATQLTELQTAYNNLTTTQKRKAYLVYSGATYIQQDVLGSFTKVQAQAGGVYISTADIINAKYYGAIVNPYNNTDYSSYTAATSIELWA